MGEPLTADRSGIADADGLSGTTFSYQWVANDGFSDAAIACATDSTYTLVAADEDKYIKLRVPFTDDAGFTYEETDTATIDIFRATDPERNPITWFPSRDDLGDFAVSGTGVRYEVTLRPWVGLSCIPPCQAWWVGAYPIADLGSQAPEPHLEEFGIPRVDLF